MPTNTSPNGVSGRSIYHGALLSPRNTPRPVAVIRIHGAGVNFYYPTCVRIGRQLAASGYATIIANARMHDLGNIAGFEARREFEAEAPRLFNGTTLTVRTAESSGSPSRPDDFGP